ncbi:glutamate decarboxylase [Methanobrevibacter sp.]|uniref:glutamate decarboxylase n=1 Tax=Methanobrevibacter sp. TaxID=66852 RepID=UPI00388DCA85
MDKKNISKNNDYISRFYDNKIPKDKLQDNGIPPKLAYELLHDQLSLDGNPSLNLASFVTTWMEKEANQLILENIGKNFINFHEYPQTYKIEKYCINIIGNLFNAPDDSKIIGASTIGSSEAILLGLLAHKWSWKKNRQKNNKSFDKPNIVMGADTHTVWEKFALYFDVELRLIPLEHGKYTINAEDVVNNVDENTICVGAVLGTTYVGQMDAINEINTELLKIKKEKGWDIPIHVDAASGGFIAPFMYPDLKWDFELEQVKSINVSGHKYGLVYPGIAWLVFKDEKYLPKELIFNINYLGGDMPNYSLNFSKPSTHIIAQYYNFLRLGKYGYKNIIANIMENAKYLKECIKKLDKFELLDENPPFPVIALTLKNSEKYTAYHVSSMLKTKGWVVPAYTLPPNAEDMEVLRIVIKENFERSMIENFIEDLNDVIEELEKY